MAIDAPPQNKTTSSSSVARSASRMGLATLCSRVLGLGREQVFAYLFGASNAADAFNIAFRIPNLLRDLFAEGAMSAAFVPNFTKTLVDSKRKAFALLAGVLAVLIVGVGILSLCGILFSRELVLLYASSYQTVPGKFDLAVGLTKSMFPFFPLVAMAAVLMGALNALGFFFLPAFAPVLFNVASIIAGITICPLLARYTQTPPIYGMAMGVVIGGFLQFYVQWWQIRKSGFRLSDHWGSIKSPFKTPGVKRVLWLLIPGTIGLAATQVGILINSIYATSAGPGAVSWLNYAFRLMQFPIGIFGVSLAAATLPQVSRKLAEGKREAAGEEISRSLRMMFAVNGPAAAGLMAVGLPIVQLLFQHGRFTYEDARQTADAVFWYALGLPGYSAVKVVVPVFYALGNTRIPVIVSFVMVAITAALNHIFLDILHYPFWCLAAATSVSATLNAVLLSVWLSRRLPGAIDAALCKSLFLQVLVSGAIGGAVVGLLKGLAPFEMSVQGSHFAQLLFWTGEVIAAMTIAGAIWFAVGLWLGIEENERASRFILKKFKRSGSKVS